MKQLSYMYRDETRTYVITNMFCEENLQWHLPIKHQDPSYAAQWIRFNSYTKQLAVLDNIGHVRYYVPMYGYTYTINSCYYYYDIVLNKSTLLA